MLRTALARQSGRRLLLAGQRQQHHVLSKSSSRNNALSEKSALLRVQQSLYPSPSQSLMLQQRRSYIFFPASLQELWRSLEQLWGTNRQERRIILVKLVKNQTNHARDYAIHIQKSSPFKKRRQRAMVAAGERWAGARANFQKYQSKGMESLQRYKRRTLNYYSKKQYHRKVVMLTEFSKADWFDKNGYPQTARDEVSGRFVNPWNSESTNGHHSFWEFCKWRFERLFARETLQESELVEAALPPELLSPETTAHTPRLLPHTENNIKLTWIGHSTTFVQMSGFTLLTDPHFSQRASPSQHFGIARHVDPAIQINDLPHVDVCCISHDHYDHLDYDSIVQLKQKVRWWVVPLGIKEWLEVECNIPSEQIVELQWWESVRFQKQNDGSLSLVDGDSNTSEQEMNITCAPAQHWCSRTPWDRNVRLWCSFAISTTNEAIAPPLKYYFGGDTGLPTSFPLHRQIGDRLGPFDLAALPIGAYAPSWFMADSHVNPHEAVQIHQDLGAKKSVAIHWGTFRLADEANEEPPLLLKEAIEDQEDPVDFVVIRQGESVESHEIVDTEEEFAEESSINLDQEVKAEERAMLGVNQESEVDERDARTEEYDGNIAEDEDSSDDDEKQKVGYG